MLFLSRLRDLARAVWSPLIPEEREARGVPGNGCRRERERLAACAFKVPVHGQMLSMCELNATGLRRELNLRNLKPREVVLRPRPKKAREASVLSSFRPVGP